MKKCRTVLLSLAALIMAGFIMAPQAFANKSAVEIEAPDEAGAGEEVVVVIRVSHDGNNFLHYTNHVVLSINGETAREWEYGAFSKPEDESFSVSFSHTAREDFEIEARAFCNRHGSDNTAVKTVSVNAAQSGGQ